MDLVMPGTDGVAASEFTLKGLPGLHRLYEVAWHDAAAK